MVSFKKYFLFISVMLTLFVSINSHAQNNEGRVFHIQTFYLEMPEDGSMSEFDSLYTVLRDNVLSKNDKILSQRVLRHLWGSDNRQLLVIREYAKIEDLVVRDSSGRELFRAYFKTDEERKTFWDKWGKYWDGHHSDEIFQEIPGGRK